jgi:RNA polymerase sigma-70 factor (ECF subfamily)
MLAPHDTEFDRLVRAHAADLFRFAYWLCRERRRAEETVHDAFVRAWREWDELREPVVAKGWLFAFVRRELAGASELELVTSWQAASADAAPPGAAASNAAEGATVREALCTLPEGLLEPLLLQVLGGFSCATIGWLLETSEDGAMRRLMRARRALRATLTVPRTACADGRVG